MLHKAELQWQLLLCWAGDCMNDNATDTGPFIAWRHANGATICSTLVSPVDDGQKLQSCCSVPSCHSMQRTQCSVWHTANIPGHVLSYDPHQPASCYHPVWHRTQSLVWFDQWNVEIKLDNLVDIFPSIMQHGLTMLVATHDTGPRRYLVSGFVRDFIWCLWQEILTRRALRQSVVP